MAAQNDKINCIKNLIQLMCCDKKLDKAERKFLAKAAKQIDVQIDDWQRLLKEVHKDGIDVYPVRDSAKAVATLKALVVMARVDGKVDESEKLFIQQFAKSIGIDNAEWKQIISEIDKENLFAPFTETRGNIIVITDDFEKIDEFCKVAGDNNVSTNTTDMQTLMTSAVNPEEYICFHGTENKEESIERCKILLGKNSEKIVCILTRFQGLQVKYMHEHGPVKCIIEPVYAQDISNIFRN